LKPRNKEDKELQKLTNTLKWGVSGHQIFYYDRIYSNVDYWLYDTQVELDEPNRIISIHTILKGLDSDVFAHSLCNYSIKYGYDEIDGGGIYKRSVHQIMEFQHCEHDMTVFLGYQTTYRRIFQHLFYESLTYVGRDVVDENDPLVVEGVEKCNNQYSVLISPHLVYLILSYLQRMSRVKLTVEIRGCKCKSYNICKCTSRAETEYWE
jgi:hypothetical protein